MMLEAEISGGVWGADEVAKEEEEEAKPKGVARNPRAPAQQQASAPVMERPQQLEAGQLLALLRQQAEGGERIRFNTFHQQVEIDGAPLEGAERFYLSLADQGFKVGKDMALDCLVQVAGEPLRSGLPLPGTRRGDGSARVHRRARNGVPEARRLQPGWADAL